jgi:hypothetical protein
LEKSILMLSFISCDAVACNVTAMHALHLVNFSWRASIQNICILSAIRSVDTCHLYENSREQKRYTPVHIEAHKKLLRKLFEWRIKIKNTSSNYIFLEKKACRVCENHACMPGEPHIYL